MQRRKRIERGMRRDRKEAFPSFSSLHRSSLFALDSGQSISFPNVTRIVSAWHFFAHFSDYRKRAIPFIWYFHYKSANLVHEGPSSRDHDMIQIMLAFILSSPKKCTKVAKCSWFDCPYSVLVIFVWQILRISYLFFSKERDSLGTTTICFPTPPMQGCY